MTKIRRTNSRVRKSLSKTDRELQAIEDLLGEDFESLSQARKALKANVGTAPYKDSYTVRELSSRKNRTVREFIADISSEQRAAEIDALKRPGDFWAAEIYGNGTYDLYGSIEQLAAKLASYRGLQEEHPRAALKHIKLIRVSGVNGLRDYKAQKRAQVEESWRLTKLKGKRNRKRERQQAKKIKHLEALVKKLRKRDNR